MATTEVKFSPEDLKAAQSAERIPEPTVVVIFGASGDLTKRKLLPALFHLEQSGLLPAGVLGGRRGAATAAGRVRERHARRHSAIWRSEGRRDKSWTSSCARSAITP